MYIRIYISYSLIDFSEVCAVFSSLLIHSNITYLYFMKLIFFNGILQYSSGNNILGIVILQKEKYSVVYSFLVTSNNSVLFNQ